MVQDPYNYNNSIYKNTELNDHHLPSALPEACPSTDPNIISRDSSMKEASNMKDTSNINDTKHHVEADPTKTANPNKYIAIPPDWSSSLICTCSS